MKFIKGYGVIRPPLTELLKKGVFGWTAEVTIAFEKLKLAMILASVLALSIMSEVLTIEIDASNVGIRAVLMQLGHPITYTS